MIVVVQMKNITQQGETYYFRLSVPKDCIDAVGKKEIFQIRSTAIPSLLLSLCPV